MELPSRLWQLDTNNTTKTPWLACPPRPVVDLLPGPTVQGAALHLPQPRPHVGPILLPPTFDPSTHNPVVQRDLPKFVPPSAHQSLPQRPTELSRDHDKSHSSRSRFFNLPNKDRQTNGGALNVREVRDRVLQPGGSTVSRAEYPSSPTTTSHKARRPLALHPPDPFAERYDSRQGDEDTSSSSSPISTQSSESPVEDAQQNTKKTCIEILNRQ
jgi:hypothetical protein